MYNSHVEAWLLHQIKVVGPNYYRCPNDGILEYRAIIGDVIEYGHSPEEAKSELMGQLGY